MTAVWPFLHGELYFTLRPEGASRGKEEAATAHSSGLGSSVHSSMRTQGATLGNVCDDFRVRHGTDVRKTVDSTERLPEQRPRSRGRW